MWPLDVNPTDKIPFGQSGARSNNNAGALCFILISRTEASPSDAVKYHTQDKSYLSADIQSAFSGLQDEDLTPSAGAIVSVLKTLLIEIKLQWIKSRYHSIFVFDLESLFNGISTFLGYLMPKMSLCKSSDAI